jgi:hypothetical protein
MFDGLQWVRTSVTVAGPLESIQSGTRSTQRRKPGGDTMKKIAVVAVLAAFGVACTQSAAAASLLGEHLTLEHEFDGGVYASVETTVTQGTDDTAFMWIGNNLVPIGNGNYSFIPAGYNVNVNSFSISVRGVFANGFNSTFNTSFPHGLVLRSDRLDIPQLLATLSIHTVGDFYMNPERVTAFGVDGVLFHFGGLSMINNIGFDASWENSAAVPEPATWATMVFGFGLSGAALRRRKAVVMAA